MNCVVCKNGMVKDGFTTVTLVRGNTTLVFRQVPAQVCENCGEEYLSEAVTDDLLAKADNAVASGVEVDVRSYKAA